MMRKHYAGAAIMVMSLMGWAVPAVATPSALMQGFSVSTKLISLTLPPRLSECTPNQVKTGGMTYTNLWSTRVDVIDLAKEKVYSNPQGFAIRDPRLSVPSDHSFADIIASSLRSHSSFVWTQVDKALKISTHALSAGRGLTLPANRKSIAPRDALVLYSSSVYDVSQGFLSDVTRGCNLVGKFLPWATSAVRTSTTTYSVIETPLSSLIGGKYDPPGAMSLSELTSIVTKSQSSSTGPLPAGFKFPEIQAELYANTATIKLTNGKRCTIFAGWAKGALPHSNAQDPFTVKVARAGTW